MTSKSDLEKMESVSEKIAELATDEAIRLKLTPGEFVVCVADAVHGILGALEDQNIWPKRYNPVTPYESFMVQMLNARIHERLNK
jgi:hypothetical protein